MINPITLIIIKVNDMILDKITTLLKMNGKQLILTHSINVAKTNIELAERFGLDKTKCEISAYCHDISGIIKPADMLEYAKLTNMYIDPAEEKYPFLLHQRISAIISENVFDIKDDEILSAIKHHSTLKANPSMYDTALFVADKLSWDQDGTPPFFDCVSDALDKSLYHAAYQYIKYVNDHNMILYPHKWFLEAKDWLERIIIND